MSRSLSCLRRGLLGIAFAGSLGFGVKQAFATPPAATSYYYCTPESCDVGCFEYNGTRGWCDGWNCWCGF
jgi:hypothetical protein